MFKAVAYASFFVLYLAACSSESTTTPQFSTGKPELLRAIDASELLLLVEIDGDGSQYTGQRQADGTWQVGIYIELEMMHTFVANWYASRKGQLLLLAEQRGEFYASAENLTEQFSMDENSSGERRFDSDCDGRSNLDELDLDSDPLSDPGCASADPTSDFPITPDVQNFPEIVQLSGDCFLMGSSEADEFHMPDQRQHEVCVEDFGIGLHEVTFEQYSTFANTPGVIQRTPNDRTWGMGTRPVINVTWRDAVAYTQWLSELTGGSYRLPTEAEWEYAARGETTTPFWTGESLRDDQEHFNSANPYGGGVATGMPFRDKTIPVGSLQPNPFGLFDMLGNVIEFTCSLYSADYENGIENECDNDMTQDHVTRGAAYSYIASWARVYHRNERLGADAVNGHIGFRVVLEKP